ncbi:MAG TPA: nuclear transport factor 2 family protein [Polyangiaceae bacterium]|nr:nuclear transport factor 2 family protein [Polyangiaceae bacterium]
MNRLPITREFAERFADEWIAAWNAHDLPHILSHYEDDFEMASARIVEIAGEPSGVLRGKEKIGAYWEKALRLSPDLRFVKLGVFLGVRSLAIHCRNQKGRLSVEVFEIGESGLVVRAAAHHA